MKIAEVCATLCLCLHCNTLSAFAEVSLPAGTVAGLPEKLTVMDFDGNSVSSDTGEYCFLVEDMQPNTAYTKDIQIMNLREGKAYVIYFYAEPLSQSGEIDLEANTAATFTLGGETVFTGSVSGIAADGSTDLSAEPIALGYYEPGESAVLTCTVQWDGTGLDGFADFGSRVVDSSGTHVIRDGNGTVYVDGEVTFRWIFYAVLNEDYTPPKTGLFSGGDAWMYLLVIAALALLVLLMLAVVLRKKRRKKSEKAS